MSSTTEIYTYLAANKDGFKESQAELLKKKLALYAMESVVFHRDISDQYEERIRSNITNEICTRLALDYETVMGVVEDIDLEVYLQ